MVVCVCRLLTVFQILLCFHPVVPIFVNQQVTDSEIRVYREKVVGMFYHAYDAYMDNAYPYDELRPLSCDGVDTWGSFSLTLIDALDTLAVIGNYSEFRRVARLVTEKANFDMNINVSVFETNIRVVGGLLSAHLLSHRAGLPLEPGWPCSGPMLRLAEELGHRLLPAFQSETGMPYGTVNLRHGVPSGETPVTCTAGVGTFVVEFGTLSRLTGDPAFEAAALRALDSLWSLRSPLGLVGNHVDVASGKWTAVDSGIGAGVDSYYEYLVKGAILLQKPQLMDMFRSYREAISRHMLRDDWHVWVNMQKGQVTLPVFQSLEAYWPGLLSLVGDIEAALKSVHNYHQVWKQFGFTPEFYNIPQSEPNNNREGYPLRPELVESLMYLYRATHDPILLRMGVDILESIQHSAKTNCGYATIKDVRSHSIEDRMESFFLAETTKYLYLLFDPDNFVHGNGSGGTVIHTSHGECVIDAGGYIFNTEAHIIDSAAVYCCSAAKQDDALLQTFHDNMDLLALLHLGEDDEESGQFMQLFPRLKKPSRPTDVTTEPTVVVEVVTEAKFVDSTCDEPAADLSDNLVAIVDTEEESAVEIPPAESLPTEEQIIPYDSPGVGRATFLGHVAAEEVSEVAGGGGGGGEETDEAECSSASTAEETEQIGASTPWSGTRPILGSVRRDTLHPYGGFSGAAGIGLMGLERNESSTCARGPPPSTSFDVLACPAQPFTLRLSIMGEMFGVH